MHRAYHALPPFKTSKGIPTNVLYGFLSILHKAVTDFKPAYVVVCFDTPVETFRNKLLATYQAQRPKAEDDFIAQIPFVKESLDAARIFHIEKDGFEADDVIGTISAHFRKNGIQVLILSGDKDIMQLVDEHTFVVSPQIGFSKTKIYNSEEVIAKLGVKPEQIPDYKALAGDPSDNYIGAKGIGPKTAAKLLARFGTVDNLMKSLDSVAPGKVHDILVNNRESIDIAHRLATIVRDVPLEFNIESSKFTWFDPGLKAYLTKFETYSLIKRIFEHMAPAPKPAPKKEEEKDKPQLSLF